MRFHLDLEDRQRDRVFVTVRLDPDGDQAHVEGVAIELHTRDGDAISARLMLPISGTLPNPLSLRTEIRARGDIPRGARVNGVVWWSGGQLETTCPTDPGTCLERFARGGGRRLPPLDLHDLPRALGAAEHTALVRAFPWMHGFRQVEHQADSHILEEQGDDIARDVADAYDLSDADRELLEELLDDDDLDDPWDGDGARPAG